MSERSTSSAISALQRSRKNGATLSSSLSMVTYLPFAADKHAFQFPIAPMFRGCLMTLKRSSSNSPSTSGVVSSEALSDTMTSKDSTVWESADATQLLNQWARLKVGIAIVKRGSCERSADGERLEGMALCPLT